MRTKPQPSDPQTLLQIYHRWDYQDYAYLWHSLTTTEKQQWETNARRLKITGFNYWMKTKLNTLPDLLGRWHLDEKSGNQAFDSSKNANTGTIYGATHTPGYIDYGLLFDCLDDYVDCGANSILRPSNTLSIETWVKFTTLGEARTLAGNLTMWSSGYMLRQTSPNRIEFAIVTSTGAWGANIWNLITNQWYHIVGTYDKDAGTNNHKAYKNGVFAEARTNIGAIIPAVINFRIGELPGNNCPDGIIDEVRVYNRVLTPAEIKRHYERRYPL